jgi:DNA-binding NtrC family response regulator
MSQSPTQKPTLILLECDITTAADFTRLASKLYSVRVERDGEGVLTAVSADAGVAAVVIGRCPAGQSALMILERVKATRTDVLRIVIAQPADLSVVVAGLHSGVVERVMHTPLEQREVLAVIALPSHAQRIFLPSAAPARPAPPAARRAG